MKRVIAQAKMQMTGRCGIFYWPIKGLRAGKHYQSALWRLHFKKKVDNPGMLAEMYVKVTCGFISGHYGLQVRFQGQTHWCHTGQCIKLVVSCPLDLICHDNEQVNFSVKSTYYLIYHLFMCQIFLSNPRIISSITCLCVRPKAVKF